MKNKLALILILVMSGCSTLLEATSNNEASSSESGINTWYAGTEYTGVIMIHGLRWVCSGGTCILKGALRQWFEHEGMPGTIGKGRWAEILL
tara:strand:- start:806 stop:1081 length:276 start_codon:yes stop_codon:yes gene_type:complete